jgi:hypothetical protein
VSDYRLDNQASGVRSPAEVKDFSFSICFPDQLLRPIQPPIQWVPGGKAWPGCDAGHSPPSSAKVKNQYALFHLSYPVGTGGSFFQGKAWPGRNTTHPYLVPRSRISTSSTTCTPSCLHGGSRTALLFT